MNLKRFVGRTSAEAMRRLREALGPDALVLANRPCAEGVELIAAAPGTLGALTADRTGAAAAGAVAAGAVAAGGTPADGAGAAADGAGAPMSTVSFQDYVRQRLRERNRAQAEPQPAGRPRAIGPGAATAALAASARAAMGGRADARHAAAATESPAAPARAASPWPVGELPDADAAAPREPSIDALARAIGAPAGWDELSATPGAPAAAPADAVVAELQSLRGMILDQYQTIGWFEGVRRNPVQSRLLRSMVAAGFSLKLARSIVSRLPADHGEREAPLWLEEVLARNLRCAPPAETFQAGRVFAFVGPTGVGKTTTTAKIAARHVLEHGPQSVVLITVDTYRMGAHDQLRAYGRILGVPVHIAHDASALHDLLRLRGPRQLVLIDTVGMGHRDERIRSLLVSLPRTDIRHVAVASAAAQPETIDESLRAYEARHAEGVVLTKLDEAARTGGALDCLVRQRLRLLGTCDGQRVPEDWHAPDAARLVRRALLAAPGGAFALDDEELPLVFGVAATLQGDAAHA
jgi:flagellar biosynthesis protein FlhF